MPTAAPCWVPGSPGGQECCCGTSCRPEVKWRLSHFEKGAVQQQGDLASCPLEGCALGHLTPSPLKACPLCCLWHLVGPGRSQDKKVPTLQPRPTPFQESLSGWELLHTALCYLHLPTWSSRPGVRSGPGTSSSPGNCAGHQSWGHSCLSVGGKACPDLCSTKGCPPIVFTLGQLLFLFHLKQLCREGLMPSKPQVSLLKARRPP